MKTIPVLLFTVFLSPTKERLLFIDNEHVRLEIQKPENISIAKSNEISFLFEPLIGIHVNTNPLFELKLEKNSVFEIIEKVQFQKNENDYLDISKPVKFSFKAKNGTKTGQYILKGKLNYFYCSDKDGWCNRFSQPFDVKIEVIP